MFKKIARLFGIKPKVTERDAGFYDTLFRSGGHRGQYHVHYSECFYLNVWRRGAELLMSLENPRILDIGCGPGQFAHFLFDSGFTDYRGIDFSTVAIDMAKESLPQWQDRFMVADASTLSSIAGTYSVAVLFEVLEHIERDLDVLSKIPAGTHVIFSVPSFGSASHVRSFSSPKKVRKRYEQTIAIESLDVLDNCPESGKTIYLVYGRKT